MDQAAPHFSLIVSTRFRTRNITRLLGSLMNQTLQDFELIVVEQNEAPLVPSLITERITFPVRHFHRPDEVGLSRGRNSGLVAARGSFLIFPDDDCWYPPDFLEKARTLTSEKNLDILTGRPCSEDGRQIQGRFEHAAQWITKANVWTTQVEWLAVWRAKLVISLGGFDNNIGVGATTPWQSAEGQDLMLRALKQGACAWYDPVLIGHDAGEDREQASAALVAKQRRYGRGLTYVMRKHHLGAPLMAYFVARALGGSIVAAVRGKQRAAHFHLAAAVGRFEGMIGRTLGNA